MRALSFSADRSAAPPPQGVHPGKLRRTAAYFLKLQPGPVPKDDFEKRLLHGDVSEATLEQLFTAVQEVFVPLLCNPKNQVGWPEVVTREVVDNMHKFSAAACATVGLTKGQTVLPVPPVTLPPDEPPRKRSSDGSVLQDGRSSSIFLPTSLSVSSVASASAAGAAAAAAAATQRDLELIHIMEAAVVTWTRQIKGVLRTDADQELKDGAHPGPLSELAFWDRKAASLAGILEQLSSRRIMRVMELLKSTRSTFFPAFEKLCAEVTVAGQECNDNVRFLAPLTKYAPQHTRLARSRYAALLTSLTRLRTAGCSSGCRSATTLAHCLSCSSPCCTSCCWCGATAATTTHPPDWRC